MRPLVEALLFSARHGLTIDEMAKALNVEKEQIETVVNAIREEYAAPHHGVELRKYGDKWRFYVKKEYVVDTLKIARRLPRRLSTAQLEVLAAVVVKGEATSRDVEVMRGKESSQHLRELTRMKLLRRKRRGRGYVYTPSDEFFEYFQIENLSQLFKEVENEEDRKGNQKNT